MYDAKIGDEVYFYKPNTIVPQRGVVAEVKSGIVTKVTIEDILPPDGSGIMIKSGRTIDTALFVVQLISTFYPMITDLVNTIFGTWQERQVKKQQRKERKKYRTLVKENRVTWFKADFFEKYRHRLVKVSSTTGKLTYVGVKKGIDNIFILEETIYKGNAGYFTHDFRVGRVGDFVYVYKLK